MNGGYDTNDAFNLMAEKGVDCPARKIRENAVIGDDPSPRSNAVLEFKKNGYQAWKQMHQYGRRWAVEGLFTSVKLTLGRL